MIGSCKALAISLAALVLLDCTRAAGATYFVATNGNNGAAGTIGSPWRTIRYGAFTMSSGDTLNIRGGNYTDDGFDLEEIKTGTTIQAYNGETVVYAPNAGSGQNAHGILISGKSNIVLNGWTVDARHCSSDGIKLDQGSYNITLTNMTVFGCPTGMGILTTGTDDVVLMNSLITHCNLLTNGWNATINDPPLHQIYLQTSGMTVQNCFIQGVTNVGGGTLGIHYFSTGSTNGVFRNNFITNCSTGIGALATYGSNCFIYNNVIVGGYSWGIQVQRMSHVYVLNNTCYTNNAQINVNRGTNVFVENNIAVGGYANNPGGIYVNDSQTIFVRNNLAYGSTVGGVRVYDYRVGGSANVTEAGNLFARTTTSANEIYDARFVSLTTGNFQLNSGSDAIGNGRAQTTFSFDFANQARGPVWDIGAWEYRILPPSQLRHVTGSP